MPSPFAAIETATAESAVAALANTTADFGGGVVVEGIFDAAYTDALGMAGAAPSLLCASADVDGVASNASVTIGGTGYTVAEIKPDGTGMTRLMLETV